MTALSDPSGDLSALWPWWVWAVLVTAALITLTARAIAHAPEQEPELSWLDQADGATTCYRGHYYQLNPARDTWVCATCHHHVPREVSV